MAEKLHVKKSHPTCSYALKTYRYRRKIRPIREARGRSAWRNETFGAGAMQSTQEALPVVGTSRIRP